MVLWDMSRTDEYESGEVLMGSETLKSRTTQ